MSIYLKIRSSHSEVVIDMFAQEAVDLVIQDSMNFTLQFDPDNMKVHDLVVWCEHASGCNLITEYQVNEY